MATCDKCGNDYDRSFEIIDADGIRHTFDSFECAISVVAPTCAHCGIRVIGHGVQAGTSIYCCGSCARHDGIEGIVDRVPVTIHAL
ncbi:MAG: hypothetical protein ABI200_06950 [Gaiellales bacterium]